jgi:uncharacterized membrane protein (DUF485 family)
MPELQTPPVPEETSDPQVERYNARLGLSLFAVYLLAYGAFVMINAFWPDMMDRVMVSGLNLAVVYGLGLIAAAFILALIYAWLCRTPRKDQA